MYWEVEHPPIPLQSAFRDFVGVRSTLGCYYMYSETDFTQEKSNFHLIATTPPPCLRSA